MAPKLTGTLGYWRGGATEIAEGKMDGVDVSFKAARAGRNGNTTTAYTGKLMGDDLKLTATREGAGRRQRGRSPRAEFQTRESNQCDGGRRLNV